MKQETTAQLRYARMSPRKTRLLLDMVRGMRAVDALVQLQFSSKVGAASVIKLIKSAIANAKHNYKMDEETLIITKAFADSGPMQYRWMPRAFGRAAPVRKRTAHVTIVLTGEASDKAKKPENEKVETKTLEEKKAPAKKKTATKKEKK